MQLVSWVFREKTSRFCKDYLFSTHGGKANPHSHLLGPSQRKWVEIGLTHLDLPSLEGDHIPFITLSCKGISGGERWGEGNGPELIWCQSWDVVVMGKTRGASASWMDWELNIESKHRYSCSNFLFYNWIALGKSPNFSGPVFLHL